MDIKTIVFDFGGVLIDWNPRYFYKDIFNDDQRMEWFLREVCNDGWNAELDRGMTFAQGIEELKKRQPEELHPLIEVYHQGWEKMLGGPLDGTVSILERLKAGGRYKLYGLTNWSAETFPIAMERYPFLKLFDGIVVSGEERLIKPDPAIFRLLIERYGFDPGHSVYIDDNLKNVEAADRQGFNAVHFTSPQALEKELDGLGVGLG